MKLVSAVCSDMGVASDIYTVHQIFLLVYRYIILDLENNIYINFCFN